MDEMMTDAPPMAPPKKSEPFGGTPKDTQPNENPDAAKMVADAKASGALKPIEDVMVEQGWDMDAGTALLLAQKKQAPGTQGKSPEELAQMLRDDPSVYEDLKALMPGGKLDMLGKKKDEAETVGMSAGEGMKDEMAEERMKGGKKPMPYGGM